jgi:hypothetical protein
MILEKKVMGLWSVDAMYSPGATEDVVIVFTPSGDGWLCFVHPCQNIVEKFKWEIDDRGLLQIKGTTSTLYYEVDEGDELALESYFDKASDMVFRDIKVEIKLEHTPQGENEVITFSEPLFVSENRFALVHRDFARLKPPSFS